MTWTDDKANLPRSVLAQLRNLARQTGANPQVIQVRYATERLMYRISRSGYSANFVLKGAWLFYLWRIPRRTTRDVDFLAYVDNDLQVVGKVFREIAGVEPDVDDGLEFDPKTLRVEEIQRDGNHQGVRVRMTARLGRSEIPTQVDLSFGEALAHDPMDIELPTVLELPPPLMRVYSKEAVVAEKLEAIVRFGTTTTRFKDYFDLYVLSRESTFPGRDLQAQVQSTFERRGTEIPGVVPRGLAAAFGADEGSQTQWAAFLRRSDAEGAPEQFSETLAAIRAFLGPVMNAAAEGRTLTRRWRPDDGWMAE